MASQQSTQSSGSQEKMGRSKRGNWFIRYCCCCCACCCREDDVHRPLLHSTTPKEQTPVPAEIKEDDQGVSGEETQQVQLVVADVEETLDSDSEQESKDIDKEEEKPVEVDLEPTERARVESGTFVRGSSQRSSWRLVPSVTQQVKEARAAANASEAAGTEEEAAPANQGNADNNERMEVTQTEQGTEQISFKSDENQKSAISDRTVTLVAQDIDDDEVILEEPVTMTFTIGSRGNREAANSSTQEVPNLDNEEHQLQGQGNHVGDIATSSAIVAVEEEKTTQENEEDSNLESNVDIDQPTTPILTEQY